MQKMLKEKEQQLLDQSRSISRVTETESQLQIMKLMNEKLDKELKSKE